MKPRAAAGFSLIELVVTMAILSIILILSTQVIESARTAVRNAEVISGSDSTARLIFTRIEEDFTSMVVRNDVRTDFESKPGNDRMSFLTRRHGFSSGSGGDEIGDRRITVVQYAHTPDGGLARGTHGYDFQTTGEGALDLDADGRLPEIPQTHFQELSSSAFRMELEYLVQSATGITTEATAPTMQENLRGVVVTLAVLDPRSRNLLGNSRMNTLVEAFSDVSPDVSTLKNWSETRDRVATQGLPGVPAALLKSIHCYQRTYIIR